MCSFLISTVVFQNLKTDRLFFNEFFFVLPSCTMFVLIIKIRVALLLTQRMYTGVYRFDFKNKNFDPCQLLWETRDFFSALDSSLTIFFKYRRSTKLESLLDFSQFWEIFGYLLNKSALIFRSSSNFNVSFYKCGHVTANTPPWSKILLRT